MEQTNKTIANVRWKTLRKDNRTQFHIYTHTHDDSFMPPLCIYNIIECCPKCVIKQNGKEANNNITKANNNNKTHTHEENQENIRRKKIASQIIYIGSFIVVFS